MTISKRDFEMPYLNQWVSEPMTIETVIAIANTPNSTFYTIDSYGYNAGWKG